VCRGVEGSRTPLTVVRSCDLPAAGSCARAILAGFALNPGVYRVDPGPAGRMARTTAEPKETR